MTGFLSFALALLQWRVGLDVLPTTAQSDHIDAAAARSGVTVIATVTTFALAVPAVMTLARRNGLTAPRVLLLGVASGQIPFLLAVIGSLIAHVFGGSDTTSAAQLWGGAPGAVRAVAIGSFLGLSSALSLWLIGVKGTERDRGRHT